MKDRISMLVSNVEKNLEIMKKNAFSEHLMSFNFLKGSEKGNLESPIGVLLGAGIKMDGKPGVTRRDIVLIIECVPPKNGKATYNYNKWVGGKKIGNTWYGTTKVVSVEALNNILLPDEFVDIAKALFDQLPTKEAKAETVNALIVTDY